MFLYKIENTIDGKAYAGITNNVERRWKEHRTYLNGNRHANKHLQAAWNLYGEQSFNFEILKSFQEDSELQKAEIDYIKQHDLLNPKKGYNLDAGGRGNFEHTRDAKNKISKSQEIAVVSMCLKTGEFKKYDRILDVARDGLNCKSISNPCAGRSLTHQGRVWMYFEDYIKNPQQLEEKRNSSQNVKARPSRYKPVFGMNVKTKKIVQYEAIYHAEKDGFHHQGIYKCCTNPKVSKSYGGYVWSFNINELDEKIKIVLENKTHKVV